MAQLKIEDIPKIRAIWADTIAVITEAQPLIPQAHGTQRGARSATRFRTSGNGIPMQNARYP